MQTEYIIPATVKQHRDVCKETRLWFIKIKWGGGRMTHRGWLGFYFNSLRLSVRDTQVSARAPSLPSCSVIAVSVATGATEPHGGQPCKEHKRPI